jgi:hypothetical protein
MDTNIIGICVTILLSVIGIAVAIYFGLRSFTNRISKQVDETKNSIVFELSGIKENIIKIITRVDDVWQLAAIFAKGQTVGTVEVELKNFGKTKITAEIAEKETRYIVQPGKGRLMGGAIAKISKGTTLIKTELEMFGHEVTLIDIGNMLRIVVPSVDPKLCTQYMSLFLKWLDTEYAREVESEVAKFEKDIKV